MPSRRLFLSRLSSLSMASFWGSHSFNIIANESFEQQIRKAATEEDFWKIIQSQFPIHKIKTYLNSGTMGPSPLSVIEKVREYSTWMEVNGEYKGAEIAREKLAKWVQAEKDEISLTHNTTEGINIMAWGLPLKKGDEVIMTTHEHVGGALPWLNRAKLDGIIIRPFAPALTVAENLELIQRKVSAKTRVIAVPHVTTTTGLVMPIKEIADLAREKGIWTCIDGAHGPGSLALNLHESGVDAYAASTHKWMLSPNGTGFLYVKKDMLDAIQAYHVGAYSDTGWKLDQESQEIKSYVPTAHRYDFATQNAALYQGVAAAIDFLHTIGKQKVIERIARLNQYLWDGLAAKGDRVEILSSPEAKSRAGIISFRLRDMDYKEFARLASKNKIRVRQVPESGLNAIRISTHIFNDTDQLDQLLDLIPT